MTDFDRGIPNGTMRIRDVGNGWVEFWFITGSSTYNHAQNWHAYFDGAWHDYQYDLARGGSWQMFGSAFITTDQTVSFTIDGSGLGWATTQLDAVISRARLPDPPGAPYFGEIETDRIHTAFDYGYDGGSPILEAEIWWSYNTSPRFTAYNTRDVWIGGLSPKTRYYFRARVRNAVGWSDFSAMSVATTFGVPDAPRFPQVVPISPYQVRGGFSALNFWDGGSPILQLRIGYGTDPDVPQVYWPGVQVNLNDLIPGQLYYFWAQARNAYGWSPLSPREAVQLPAGAWVKQGDTWRRAIPWVNVNGTWLIFRPNISSSGTWKVPIT